MFLFNIELQTNNLTNIKMKQSGFLSLGWRDFLRGLLMAVLTPIATLITNSLEKGELTLNWHLLWLSAVGGAVAYILKNLFTKPDVVADGPGGSNPPPDPDDK
jgi:hypothetical protein